MVGTAGAAVAAVGLGNIVDSSGRSSKALQKRALFSARTMTLPPSAHGDRHWGRIVLAVHWGNGAWHVCLVKSKCLHSPQVLPIVFSSQDRFVRVAQARHGIRRLLAPKALVGRDAHHKLTPLFGAYVQGG